MKSSFYLPPEWAPQSGVMLTWPNAYHTWVPSLEIVETCFVEIVRCISLYEKVLINCMDETQRTHILKLLSDTNANLSRIQYFLVPSNDVWARDHGPITVLEQNKTKLLNFHFNGWGNKYPSSQDDKINAELHKQGAFKENRLLARGFVGDTSLRTAVYRDVHEDSSTVKPKSPAEDSFCKKSNVLKSIDWVLEGGSIEVDGVGTLLTTESCVLNPNRNIIVDRVKFEQTLKTWFGVNRILWLSAGYMAGDDTDGHIDTLARFTDTHTIVYVQCDDSEDEHYDALLEMRHQLESFETYEGQPYKLVGLPMPAPKLSPAGKRLPATYANFLIINQAVLVPTYEDTADIQALEILQTCFPDRKIMPISCRHLIEQYGSLHCVTMQLPMGVL